MRAKNIIEVTDFSQKEWIRLIDEAIQFKKNPHRKEKLLNRKRVGLVFDDNSLRTRLSFEIATHLLGGTTYFVDVHSVTHEKNGAQREVFEDIVETMDKMIDVYVLRDYSRQLFNVFIRKSYPPFINGFCGVGHPSQALADLAVIKWKKGTNKGLTYVGIGPSAGSGVMESFAYGVLLLGEDITLITETGKFNGKNADFHQQVKCLSKRYGGKLILTKNSHDIIPQADVLYVDEWWENKPNYLARKIGKYKVDGVFLKNSKKNLSVLHCLPAHPGREITSDIMYSNQSLIFDEAEFRIYSAMALLSYLSM